MTCIENILSRALLVRDRHVPRDIVPLTPPPPNTDDTPIADAVEPHEAAEDLRALCETLVGYTPARDVATFVTDQVPAPRSALVLACVLQLTDTNDGARFWWEYAAGAGQSAAAYCLYLHHLALGEQEAASWWYSQADGAPDPSDTAAPQAGPSLPPAARAWHADNHRVSSASTTTILRVLRHLAKCIERPRTAVVTELMTYVPTAVATGYLREPDIDLPMPGPDFARQIRALLETAAHRPAAPRSLPARPTARPAEEADHATQPSPLTPTVRPIGEAAAR
ncbi:hypothetical protein ACFWXK_38970 [Streptomyces sp. NPDC059070]|uniref:hypothetical protein n=1 Tax=Streptomyces sp. NPDC059070 TaxID=3346713 RepID=UPI0036B66D38